MARDSTKWRMTMNDILPGANTESPREGIACRPTKAPLRVRMLLVGTGRAWYLRLGQSSVRERNR